jgi:hypothetical protein
MPESAPGDPPPRGPRGARKHQPGRAHDRKSLPSKKKRFARKVAIKRLAKEEDARRAWKEWDELSDDVKKLLGPAGQPMTPRPRNGS